MWIFSARLLAIGAGTLLLLHCNGTCALARGSLATHDDPWNSEHIDRLPLEVRNAVIHMCSNPRAGHYFATYFNNSQLIKLHFEHLHCHDQAAFCGRGGCLHQEYVSTRGHYRLMKSYYGRGDD